MTALRSAGWYAYPWNLDDIAAHLSSMRSSAMTHLAIASSYHAGKFIQPRDPRRRVYFPEDGTVYFHFDGSRYGRLKPVVARVTQERDALREACEASILPIRGWTVLNHNSRLGWQHPEVVARNAWGDAYYYSLCPSHEDVQDYVVSLCSDLAASYDLECLLLESPGWLVYEHGYHHEFAQVERTPEIDRLLGLCFCGACIARARPAGIDAIALKGAVANRIDALFAGRDGESSALDEELAAFDSWRASVVTQLCQRIREEVRADVGIRAISTCQRPHRTSYLEGGDLAALASVVNGLELPIYQPSAATAAADLAYVVDTVGDVGKLSVILRPGFPDIRSQAQLDETLRGVLNAGIGDISFYNFGLLPEESIEWTLQAVAHAWSQNQ